MQGDKKLYQLCDVDESHTTGNRGCEQINRALLKFLGTENILKKHLATLVHCYKCTPRGTTGYSPYMLMFGHKPKLLIDTLFVLYSQTEQANYTQYIKRLKNEMKYCNRLIEEYLKSAAAKTKADHNLKQRGHPITIGDHVLVQKTSIKVRHTVADK